MKIYTFKRNEFFDLNKILYGQCFRWRKNDKNEFIGVVENNVIKIWQDEETVYYYALNNDNIETYIKEYFDLTTDYNKIFSSIKVENDIFKDIIKYSKGTRILNQPTLEIIVSYIFSSSNNIPRIQSAIEKLCNTYGNKLEFEENIYYTFPTLEVLENITEQEYRDVIRIGYRAKYVADTIANISNNKEKFNDLNKIETIELRNMLLELPGVGPKVADCILLFSQKRRDVFPIDTWIEKVVKVMANNENMSKKDMHEYIEKIFGKNKGIVNHYMFYWGRENKI